MLSPAHGQEHPKPEVTVVIPCYNEQHTLQTLLTRLQTSLQCSHEVIIVDDGSTDGTSDLLRSLVFANVRVLTHARNMGKGAALRTAKDHIRGRFVVIQDADLEYDPRDIPLLLARLESPRNTVVFGTRFGHSYPPNRPGYWLNRCFNSLLTTLCNALTGHGLTDVASGYKAFRSDTFQRLPFREDGFACDTEIAIILGCSGLRVDEVSISYNPRTYAEGKKVRVPDGLRALWVALRTRWSRCPGLISDDPRGECSPASPA